MTGTAEPGDEPIDRTRPAEPRHPIQPPELPADAPQIPGITLSHEIARGGMGIVYAGRQDFLDRRVAVKLLARDLAGEKFAARFRREAKILAGIKHPHIVACHSAGTTDDGQSYLVMEFIDGPNLKNWIREHGSVPIPAALRLTKALAQALSHALTLGVIHRDVKAENILLENVTSTAIDVAFPFTPKLVDLGLARMTSEVVGLGLTSPGSVMGTPSTMSPEQFDDPDSVDYRTDIYGLGCVLYEMLVGAPAYRGNRMTEIIVKKRQPIGPNPSDENPAVPLEVGRLVSSMLAADREQRPKNYKDLDERLGALLEKVTRQPPPAATMPPPKTRPPAEATRATVVGGAPAEAEGPGLLKTAELDFLSKGFPAGNEAFGASVPPAFAPAPSGPVTPVPDRRGLWIGVVVALAGLGGGAVWWLTKDKTDRPPKERVNNAAPTAEITGPEQASIQRWLQFSVNASDADGDALTYEWSSPQREISYRSTTNPTFEAKIDDGLPGESFTVECRVGDGHGAPTIATAHVEITETGFPTRLLHLGFKQKDSKWAFDPPEPEAAMPAWNWNDSDAFLSCRSPRARHAITLPMGDEQFWKVEGRLDVGLAAVDESGSSRETPAFGTVIVRVETGTTGIAVHCRKTGDETHEWSIDLQQCELEGAVWRSDPMPDTRQLKWIEDQNTAEAPLATVSITRRRDKLTIRFGRAGDTDFEEYDTTLKPGALPKLSFAADGGRAGFHGFTMW